MSPWNPCFAAPRNAWKVLGLPEGASREEIKAAYRQLALKYHPDVDKSEEAPQRFWQVQQAYKSLVSSAPSRPRRKAPSAPPERPKSAGSRWGTRVERGFYEEGRPMSEFLEKVMPSRQTFAYATLVLILAPYVLSLFASASYMLSSWYR